MRKGLRQRRSREKFAEERIGVERLAEPVQNIVRVFGVFQRKGAEDPAEFVQALFFQAVQNVVNAVKIEVKGRAVDVRFRRDLLDGDFVDGVLQGELHKGFFERFFGVFLFHSEPPFLIITQKAGKSNCLFLPGGIRNPENPLR